jgi:hypothetical protein
MKKVIITTIFGLFSISAYANVGDTLKQSYSRYGRPFGHNQNSYAFSWKHTVVSEWIDPANSKVGMICYIKDGSKITEQEYTAFCRQNLPHYLDPDSAWVTGAKEGGIARTMIYIARMASISSNSARIIPSTPTVLTSLSVSPTSEMRQRPSGIPYELNKLA